MKKGRVFFITVLSYLTIVGCGENAHITDSLLEVTLPSVSDPVLPTPTPYEVRTYLGAAVDGIGGFTTTNFLSELDGVGVKAVEDFDAMTDGTVVSVTNTLDGISYTLLHTDDDGALGGAIRNNYIEDPVSQDGATSGSRGLDLRFGSGTSKNMLSVSFDMPVSHIGLDVIDFESSVSFTVGELRLYDCTLPSPSITQTVDLDFGVEDGDAEVHFVGVSSTEIEFCHFTLSSGDDGPGGGLSEKFAIDNLRFGTAVLVP